MKKLLLRFRIENKAQLWYSYLKLFKNEVCDYAGNMIKRKKA